MRRGEKGRKKKKKEHRGKVRKRDNVERRRTGVFQASAYKCMELRALRPRRGILLISYSLPLLARRASRDRPCSLTFARGKFARSLILASRAIIMRRM